MAVKLATAASTMTSLRMAPWCLAQSAAVAPCHIGSAALEPCDNVTFCVWKERHHRWELPQVEPLGDGHTRRSTQQVLPPRVS